jgi:threonine synthase
MVEVRAKVALLAVFALVGATTFTAGAVGPIFGVTPSTGQADDVEAADEGLRDSSDEVGSATGFNPVATLGILASAFNILGNSQSTLVNLSVPSGPAGYLTTGIGLIIGLAIVQIALRQRL